MRKLLIWLALVAAATGALLLALTLVLNRFIAHNHDRILERVPATLGGASRLMPSPPACGAARGWRFANIRVADDPQFSETTFVTAGALTARVNLWSLLRRQPEADRIDLVRPEIHLISRCPPGAGTTAP